MIETSRPVIHDTRNPLACCTRCHKAELAGRARRRPVFRFERVDAEGQRASYRMFHGEHHVATLSRARKGGPASYEVRVEWDTTDGDLRAGTMRDARAVAEEAYTTVWRTGQQPDRGPALDL